MPERNGGLTGPGSSLRRRVLQPLLLVSGVVALLFVPYHLALGRGGRALASVSALVVAVVLFARLRSRPASLRPVAILAVLYAAGMTLWILGSPAFPEADFVWCLLVPPMVAWAAGPSLARWLLPAYLAAASAIVLAPGFAQRAHWIEYELHIRFVAVLTLVTAMAWIYEAARSAAQRKLAREVEVRRAAEAELEASNRALLGALTEADRLVDQARSDSQAKTELLANVSHDLKSPLSAIFGATDLLEMSGLAPTDRQPLETLRLAGGLLAELITNTLDLSRLQAGRLELDRGVVDLRELVEDVRMILATTAHRQGLRLVMEVADEVPGAVLGDPLRLRQVLLNLAGNSVKFTEQGEVVVRVTAEGHAGAERFVLSVRDTGPGIPAELHERIFESFVQASPSGGPGGGSGLGLTICRSLVDLMGGAIELHSAVGEGSTFEVALPLVRAEEQPAAGST
jgi:signal transduction histidine kinase